MHRPRVYLSASVVRIGLLSLLDCPLGQLVRSQSALANERSSWLVVHTCQRRYLADQLLENSRSDRRLRQADRWSDRQNDRLICQLRNRRSCLAHLGSCRVGREETPVNVRPITDIGTITVFCRCLQDSLNNRLRLVWLLQKQLDDSR